MPFLVCVILSFIVPCPYVLKFNADHGSLLFVLFKIIESHYIHQYHHGFNKQGLGELFGKDRLMGRELFGKERLMGRELVGKEWLMGRELFGKKWLKGREVATDPKGYGLNMIQFW